MLKLMWKGSRAPLLADYNPVLLMADQRNVYVCHQTCTACLKATFRVEKRSSWSPAITYDIMFWYVLLFIRSKRNPLLPVSTVDAPVSPQGMQLTPPQMPHPGVRRSARLARLAPVEMPPLSVKKRKKQGWVKLLFQEIYYFFRFDLWC